MEKERTIKELLQLMLRRQCEFSDGLCIWVKNMYWEDEITKTEGNKLHKYIKENRPKNLYWLMKFDFYWKFDDIKPRIKWIKKHIARFKK